MIDKGICDKGFVRNPGNCECECDKSYDVKEYLDYENCKCRKRLIDKLVGECIENIDVKELHQNKIICNSTLNDYENICSSCMVYKALFAISSITSTSISSAFFFNWNLKRKYTEKTIY